MTKKWIIYTKGNGSSIEAFAKNCSENERYLTVKKAVTYSNISLDPETTLKYEFDVAYIPWTSIELIEEKMTDEEEPGARPQPEKPKTKMWRMGKTEEIIPES